MYILLRETTIWTDTDANTNGTYVFEKRPKGRIGNVIGYISRLTDEVKWFKAPLSIYMRGRSFVEVGK